MKSPPIADAIQKCLKDILGEDCSYVPKPQPGRLKDRTRVWRLTGSMGMSLNDKGEIFYTKSYGPTKGSSTRITRENWKDVSGEWEFLVLERGPERVEQELRDALADKGHAVVVNIGYAASITVRPLAASIKAATTPDEATLAELASISEALAAAASNIEVIALRLRRLHHQAEWDRAWNT